MTVKDIIVKYLRDNRYDGLCGRLCDCEIDKIGEYCNNDIIDCKPAVIIKCSNNSRKKYNIHEEYKNGEMVLVPAEKVK